MNKTLNHRSSIRLFILLILSVLSLPLLNAQGAYRIKADFSIKIKSDSIQSLTMGKVYYDKNIGKLVYVISFPTPEIWVQKDTSLFRIVNGLVVDTTRIPYVKEFTIFHLALSGQLPDYGLKGSAFELESVEKDSDLVIKTYAPPARLRKDLGKVKISNKDRRLHGIVFLNSSGKTVSKQFFENYIISRGVAFPGKVVQITPLSKGKDLYQVTTYRNIVIDGSGEDNYYNYPVRTR
jgi:hypothetical protein